MTSVVPTVASPNMTNIPLSDMSRPRRVAAVRKRLADERAAQTAAQSAGVSPSPSAASTQSQSRPRLSRSTSRALQSPDKAAVSLATYELDAHVGDEDIFAPAMSRAASSSSSSASITLALSPSKATTAIPAGSVPPPTAGIDSVANGLRGKRRRASATSRSSSAEDKRRRLSGDSDHAPGSRDSVVEPGIIVASNSGLTSAAGTGNARPFTGVQKLRLTYGSSTSPTRPVTDLPVGTVTPPVEFVSGPSTRVPSPEAIRLPEDINGQPVAGSSSSAAAAAAVTTPVGAGKSAMAGAVADKPKAKPVTRHRRRPLRKGEGESGLGSTFLSSED